MWLVEILKIRGRDIHCKGGKVFFVASVRCSGSQEEAGRPEATLMKSNSNNLA